MGLFSFVGKIVGKIFKIFRPVLDWLVPSIDTPERQGLAVGREGSNLPIPVVYGVQKVGSIKVHKYVTDQSGGADNEFLHLICIFCEGEIDRIGDISFNGVSETDPRWNKSGGGKYFTIERFIGTDDQAASTSAVANIPNWTSNHRLRGLAYAYIRLQVDKKQTIWRSGEPEISAIIHGKKILDTRTGFTAISDNPAMCLRDYLTNARYGKGLSASRLIDADFQAAANLCDEVVSYTRTFTRQTFNPVTGEPNPESDTTSTYAIKRFTCNLILDTSRTVFENTQEILGVFRGILPPSFITGPIVEGPGSPVFDFDVDNIVGAISVDTGTVNDRKNRIFVRFPNKNGNYEYDEVIYPEDDDPIRATWLAEDNNRNLEGKHTFNGITDKAEALQAAQIIAVRSRFTTVVSITVMPIGLKYDVGDIISVTDGTHGWAAKPFRVTRKDVIENGLIRFSLIEHEDSIYPFSGVAYEDRQGGTYLGNPQFIDTPENLTFTADQTLTTSGTLEWDASLNLFVRRYNVIVTRTHDGDGTQLTTPLVISDIDVFDANYVVPTLDVGTYSFSVSAVSTLGVFSSAAVLIQVLAVPAPPTSISITSSNFELECRPVLSGIGIGTVFEFAIIDTTIVRGRGASIVFVGLVPDTEYTVFARSVNAYGISAWVSATATTTNDAQPIIDLIGDDIAGAILPSVLEELQDDLQVVVNMSLNDYSTTTEINNLIQNQISQVNESAGEDIRINIVEGVVDVFVDGEAERSIITETFVRETQVNEITATVGGNTSMITQVNQALADETSARTTQINQLTATVNTDRSNSAAQFVTVNQAIADETSARTTSINQLSATVNGNTATITTNSEAISDEVSLRASQVTSLQAADTAILSQVGMIESTANGNNSAISSLTGTVNNPSNGLAATFIIASSARTTANNASSSATSITNTVNNPVNGLGATFTIASGARTTADDNLQSIGGLRSSITGTNSQSQAELILSSTFSPELGQAFSRAFLGVSSTTNGVSQITGILADGATNALDFRADVFRLTDTSGNVRLRYSTTDNRWVFNGALEAVTGTFAGALSGATGSFSGAINAGTGSVINGAFISDLSVDTLQIANQAVTVPTSVEFGDVTVSGTTDRSFPAISIGTYVGGGVLFNFALNGIRTTSSSSNDEFLNLTVRIRSGSTSIKTFNYNMGLPNRNLPNTTTCAGVFSEAVLSGRIGQNLNILITADPQGVGSSDRTTLGGTGYVQYAKK